MCIHVKALLGMYERLLLYYCLRLRTLALFHFSIFICYNLFPIVCLVIVAFSPNSSCLPKIAYTQYRM